MSGARTGFWRACSKMRKAVHGWLKWKTKPFGSHEIYAFFWEQHRGFVLRRSWRVWREYLQPRWTGAPLSEERRWTQALTRSYPVDVEFAVDVRRKNGEEQLRPFLLQKCIGASMNPTFISALHWQYHKEIRPEVALDVEPGRCLSVVHPDPKTKAADSLETRTIMKRLVCVGDGETIVRTRDLNRPFALPPKGTVWMEGDNVRSSLDSNWIGYIPMQWILCCSDYALHTPDGNYALLVTEGVYNDPHDFDLSSSLLRPGSWEYTKARQYLDKLGDPWVKPTRMTARRMVRTLAEKDKKKKKLAEKGRRLELELQQASKKAQGHEDSCEALAAELHSIRREIRCLEWTYGGIKRWERGDGRQ